MENKNYNFEDKINLIYNYLYNKKSNKCFSIEKISLGKISLNDVKISLPSNNKEEKEEYNQNKSDILDGRFKLISFNDKTYELLFKRYSNQIPVNIKINFYKDYKSINLLENSINNDSIFSYILSELVLSKKTKHILLPIMNLDINFSDIENIISDETSKTTIKNAILDNDIKEVCCLQIREHFFQTVNLKEYLRDNTCLYKPLLFQVIHTLAIIQKEFNGFRHNNLTLSNILVYNNKSSDIITEYEGFKNDKFYLNNSDSDIDIKITNFEHAIIPKFYGMFNTKNKKIKFADKHNPYYDLYTFLNELIEIETNVLFKNDKNKCDSETKKFLDKIIPPEIRGLSKNKFDKNIIVANPIDLLYDDYFKEYTNKKSKPDIKYNKTINSTRLIKNDNTYLKLSRTEKIVSLHGGKSTSDKLQTRTIKNNMVGGSITTPPYKSEKNNPFLSNDQKETFKKTNAENIIREPPVILEQKISK